jgi:hypothetical protein
MKRIVKIGLPLLLAFLIPAGILNAQEKKNEQRIKIIIADKSGTNVEIDTLIKGDVSADSIKLKNGEVIYLARHDAVGTIKHIEGESGSMYVTVTSDDKGDKGDKKIIKEITVISDDSAHVHQVGEGSDVINVKGGKHFTEGKGDRVVTWSSSEGDSKGERYIYINEGKDSGKKGEKTFNVEVTTDEKGNSVEKTKYVIAKDGVVVSIEGNDEAKVKELVKDVESKLGVSKGDKNIKQVVKEETKKTTKK